jgi:DNA-binding NtrC family response regulator
MADLTVLYVDDTASDIELMRALLARKGIKVEGEMNAKNAVSSYDPARHRAVIIDWNLSSTNGGEVAKALLVQHPQCLIIFISGLLLEEHVRIADSLGVPYRLEKDMDMQYAARIGDLVLAHAHKEAV